MAEHKDRNLIGYSDSADYREKYDTVFGKKFKWKKIEIYKEKKVIVAETGTSDSCSITNQNIMLGVLQELLILCKDTPNGKCAYCGDVSVESDTERKIQCFYPVAQDAKRWKPECKVKS